MWENPTETERWNEVYMPPQIEEWGGGLGLPRTGGSFTGWWEVQVLGDYVFALPYRWATQISFICGKNSYFGKDPQFKFFRIVKGGAKVPLECTEFLLLLAQNNPLGEVALLGKLVPNPLVGNGVVSVSKSFRFPGLIKIDCMLNIITK